jgi:hypothetical protein
MPRGYLITNNNMPATIIKINAISTTPPRSYHSPAEISIEG